MVVFCDVKLFYNLKNWTSIVSRTKKLCVRFFCTVSSFLSFRFIFIEIFPSCLIFVVLYKALFRSKSRFMIRMKVSHRCSGFSQQFIVFRIFFIHFGWTRKSFKWKCLLSHKPVSPSLHLSISPILSSPCKARSAVAFTREGASFEFVVWISISRRSASFFYFWRLILIMKFAWLFWLICWWSSPTCFIQLFTVILFCIPHIDFFRDLPILIRSSFYCSEERVFKATSSMEPNENIDPDDILKVRNEYTHSRLYWSFKFLSRSGLCRMCFLSFFFVLLCFFQLKFLFIQA